jgi:UDP-N-acetylmuramate--alanine ligase
LHLTPEIAVILSMDADHLDIYGSQEEMLETGFKEFVKNVKADGTIIVQDELAQLFDNQEIETYGIKDGDFRAERVGVVDGGFHFDFVQGRKSHYLTKVDSDFWTPLPGRHNVENTLAAMAIATKLGVSTVDLRKGLRTFKGIKRRFEFILREENLVFINDYAHHPTELTAAISAAKELFPNRKITGIFQPHLYSRTRDFQEEFAHALDLLNECLLMDIYPAREEPIGGVDSGIVFEKMTLEAKELVTKETLMNVLKNKEIEVLIMLGAGDIVDFIEPIKQFLVEK